MRPPGTRTLHQAPTALRERRVFSPPSLSSLLRDAGFDDEATKWFEQQDVADVTSASQLSHHELEKIIADRATVGRVRLLHQLLSQQAQARARAHMDTLEPTASSVFGRSMLLMGASELKHANLTRLTSESVFASLMLTIAVGALIESPTVDDCVPNFGQDACERLMEGYVATFGTASAFFLGSCLVTLGAVNFFHNMATSETVHFVTVASELYSSSSFLFTSCGLLFGLLPGSCVNTFLRFSGSPKTCIYVSVLHWLVWLWQFCRAYGAVVRVYGGMPGYQSFSWFFAGVMGFVALQPVADAQPSPRLFNRVASRVRGRSRGLSAQPEL